MKKNGMIVESFGMYKLLEYSTSAASCHRLGCFGAFSNRSKIGWYIDVIGPADTSYSTQTPSIVRVLVKYITKDVPADLGRIFYS